LSNTKQGGVNNHFFLLTVDFPLLKNIISDIMSAAAIDARLPAERTAKCGR